MPKGPQGQKRPADTVANAIRVAKILTGQIEKDMGDSGKDNNVSLFLCTDHLLEKHPLDSPERDRRLVAAVENSPVGILVARA
jgi:hypothetical protein